MAIACSDQARELFANCFNFRGNNVGGVSIDAKGVVSGPSLDGRNANLQQMRQDIKKPAADLARPVELRMVSLRGLEAAVADAQKNKMGVLPDEVRFLAGIQRIQYVFVYPEANDIILAGPGEGWKVRDDATVVGVTTDRPVVLFDDLIVALRTSKAAREASISCSIDPTPEGRRNLDAFLAKQKTFNPTIPAQIEKAMGPQVITLTGVPTDSHLARVLVAADYRMKRIAMHLDPSPIKELPSFISMMQAKKSISKDMMPRWWLACNYEPLGRSEDGLAWELRGPGVKCMTEDDFIGADGGVKGSGKQNPMALAWANQMTEVYDKLAVKDPVFGDLRNVMDLCVVAALIDKEEMLSKAKLELPLLMSETDGYEYEKWNSPKQIATQSSFLKAGREYIITASGGVEVTSWEVASKSEVSEKVGQTRAGAKAPEGASWWAN
ncbi:MAG TPA: DUF1598 domain-containing protein [Pirellulaceae bacterium]|nr:DUF1598 domain-containing protein [Pirellulaceae bacterium]